MKRLLAIALFLCCANMLWAQSGTVLIDQLKSMIGKKRATVGVAMIFNGSELMTINNQYRYPMLGVVKFHQALAVLDHVAKSDQTLETEVFVKKAMLRPGTHSPLRDNYPAGDFVITLTDLLRYSLSQSDNIASDVLYDYIGGPKVVQNYVEKLGVKDVSIELTEAQVEKDEMNLFHNWCKPSSAVLMMETFLQNDLFPRPYKLFLERAMIESPKSDNRLKALLPEKEVLVAHKSGSSGRNEYGIKMGDNDLGFVLLPNGAHYSIAVFIMNSYETDESNAALIANISKAVYDYFVAHYGEKGVL